MSVDFGVSPSDLIELNENSWKGLKEVSFCCLFVSKNKLIRVHQRKSCSPRFFNLTWSAHQGNSLTALTVKGLLQGEWREQWSIPTEGFSSSFCRKMLCVISALPVIKWTERISKDHSNTYENISWPLQYKGVPFPPNALDSWDTSFQGKISVSDNLRFQSERKGNASC